MSFESIDNSSANDTFTELKNRIFKYANAETPDIKERLEIETKLRTYLKVPKSDLVLNFIIECIHAVNEQGTKKETSS